MSLRNRSRSPIRLFHPGECPLAIFKPLALSLRQGVLKEPNLAKEAGQGLLGMVSAYTRGDLGGMANTAMGLFKRATRGDEAQTKTIMTKTSPADVIMWSGSKDTQTSYVNILSLPNLLPLHVTLDLCPRLCGGIEPETGTWLLVSPIPFSLHIRLSI